MKTVEIGTQPALAAILKSAQKQRLLLTNNGRPAAVVLSLENYDAEDFALASSEEFWEMIEARRRSTKGVPLAELKARLKEMSRPAREAPRSNPRKKSRSLKSRS
jgi:prevent-host-death family protein